MSQRDFSSVQSVLAHFVENVVDKSGWWFRLPKFNPKAKQPHQIVQDVVMPHLGRLFGLAEEASALVLVEMGLMTHKKTGAVVFREAGWADFGGTFIVDGAVEVSKVTFEGKQCHYVRIGLLNKALFISPSAIWKEYKKNNSICCPVKLCDRRTSLFVKKELRTILTQSEFFD